MTALAAGQRRTARSLDGTEISWRECGDGEPLLLVHGSMSDHTRWLPVIELVRERFRVCALDRRGHGESGDASAYSIEREYEDVAVVLEALGSPAHVVGSSYGAICALYGVARDPSRARTLVLYEPPIPVGVPLEPGLAFFDRAAAVLAAEGPEAALELTLREASRRSEAEIERLRGTPWWEARVAEIPVSLRESSERQSRLDRDLVATVDVPCLLLKGELSAPFLRAAVDVLAGVLPRAEVHELAGQGHGAVSEAPELVAALVMEFSGHPGPPPAFERTGGGRAGV